MAAWVREADGGLRSVRLQQRAGHLHAWDGDEQVLRWDLDAMRALEDTVSDRRAFSAAMDDRTLLIGPGTDLMNLQAAREHLRSPAGPAREFRSFWVYMAAGTALVALLASGALWVPELAIHNITWADEKAWADQALEWMEPTLCPSEEADAVLDLILQRLSEGMPADRIPMEIHIVDGPEVNAFASLGGHIFLMRGLLEEVQSLEEVAGILAHEVGHVLERHALRQVLRSVGFTVVLSTLGTVDGRMVGQLREASQSIPLLTYSRDAEREADAWAVRLLQAGHISSEPLTGFFDRHGAADGMALFRSHPNTSERVAFIESQVRSDPVRPLTGSLSALRNACTKP